MLKKLAIVLVATLIGLTIAYAVGLNAKSYAGLSIVFICAIWAFVLNWIAFIPAAIAQTEKFYDLTGSLTYISTIGLAAWLSQPLDARATIVAILVTIWATRLGTFLFRRIARDKGDQRFNDIKVNPPRFLVAWTLQGLWVVLTAIAAVAIITTAEPQAWGLWASLGLVVWIIGFSLEAIADAQKSAFKQNPENEGDFIQYGLWARSQHPNYFGEIVLWIGIAIMALPILSGLSYLALISPLFVIFLLTKVSGIPLLQKRAKEKWGDDPNYQSYKNTTPLLIPKLSK